MVNTAKVMLESETGIAASYVNVNRSIFESFSPLTEAELQLTGYTPEKVCVLDRGDGRYFIEFSGNLERLMQDQKIDIDEAVELVCSENNIEPCDIGIIFDEAAIEKINMRKLQVSTKTLYDLYRK